MNRRQALVGTTSIIAGLAGCSRFSTQSAILDLTLFNHAETAYTVELSLFKSEGDPSRSAARVYEDRIHVPPAGRAEREAIAEVQPYITRYSVYENNTRLTDQDHIHYYPHESSYVNSTAVDTLAFDINAEGGMTRR